MELHTVDPPDAYVPLPVDQPGEEAPPAPPDSGVGAYFMEDSELILGESMHPGFDGAAVAGDQTVQAGIVEPAEPAPEAAPAPAPVKRKRGRPPKNPGGAGRTLAAAKKKREEEEEIVCFICFDGGNLVVCDRRGCPKVYHPACVGRDDAFFRTKARWNCGWHICSKCRKSANYMCYTCTNSLCKGCIKEASILCVRGNKGFCETCYGTVMLIESGGVSNQEKVDVDFDDKSSWHYLFKLYWLALKQKLLLTVEELSNAKSPWKTTGVSACNEESSDELYTGIDDQEESSDSSPVHRESNISRKRNRRRSSKPVDVVPAKVVSNVMSNERKSLPEGTEWASPQLLEFTAHMRNGDISVLTQFDVQALLLEYIKQNNLRDPRRKSQIICDTMLQNLFHKQRVGHFEMLKLLESHFLIKETSQKGIDENQEIIDPHSDQLDAEDHFNIATGTGFDRKRKLRKKVEEREPQNTDDYAAIDIHNVNLIYLRRNLLEDLIDDSDAFKEKVMGAFVRIRIPGAGQKQDMYRLVKIIGTHVVAEKYKVGKKTTNVALDILNLDKTEKILMDTISNQNFTEEECKRLRQSIKCGLINRLTVGDVLEKAKVFQAVRVNDWLESEKLRLSHLRDRASETGRRKELRECVEKLQLLSTPEERMRRLNDLPEIHVDTHMDPNYESPEELDVKKGDNYKRLRESLSRKKANNLLSPSRGSISSYNWKDFDKSTDNSWLSNKSLPVEGFQDKFVIGDKPNGLIQNQGNSMGTTQTMSTNSNVSFWNDNELLGKPEGLCGSSGSLLSPVTSESMLSQVESKTDENDKVWHYLDPSGKMQGPFSVIQLRKWNNTGYFPPDMRVWLTSQKQEEAILLTEALAKAEKDLQKEALQQANVTQFGNFTARNDATQNHLDYSLKGNNAFTSVEIRQNGRQWSENQGGSVPPTMGNDVSTVDRWAPHVEPPSTRSGSAGMPPRGWESSKDIKTWNAQPQVSGNPNSIISAPHSGNSYHLPVYQDRGSHQEIVERWNKNPDHQSLWNSNASRDIRPSTQVSDKQYSSQNSSSEHKYQPSNEEYQKTYPLNEIKSKRSSESVSLPTSNNLQVTSWSGDQSLFDASSVSTAFQSSQSNWHASQNSSVSCMRKSQFFEDACPSPTPQSPVQTNEPGDSKRVIETCKSSAAEGWCASFASAPLSTDCIANERQDSVLSCETKKNHTLIEDTDEKTPIISPTINSASGCGDKSVSDERPKDSSILKPVSESREVLLDPIYGQNSDGYKSGPLTSGNMMTANLLEIEESNFTVPELTEFTNPEDMENIEWSFPSPTPASRDSEWDIPSPTPESSRIITSVSCDVLKASTSPRLETSRLAESAAFEHVTSSMLSRNGDPVNVENLEWGQAIGKVNQNWGSTAVESGEVAWETPALRDKNEKTGCEMTGHGNMNANSSCGTPAPGTNLNSRWQAQPRRNMNNYGGWGASTLGQDIGTAWGLTREVKPNFSSWGTANVRTQTSWGTGEAECATENVTWNMPGAQGNANVSSSDIWGTSLENANLNSRPRNFDNPGTRRYDRDRYQEGGNDRDSRFRSHSGVGRGSSQQGPRGICKFYESGHCKRGSSCKYLHP